MLIAFIAGPFRGSNPWEVEQNIRRAEEVAFKVAELGIMPLCPHTNTRFFDGTLTDEFWLEGTSELLRRCDMVVLAEKDAESKSMGTLNECIEARYHNMPVYSSVGELEKKLFNDTEDDR